MLNKPARWLPFVTWFPLMSIGFYVGRKFPSTWDVGVFIFTTETSAVILLLYLCVWDLLWKAYLGSIDTQQALGLQKKEPEKTTAPYLVDGKLQGEIYTQSTTIPRFDLEKYMATVVLNDIENGRESDFRETTWVAKNRHSRFPNRNALVKVLRKWERVHAIKRKFPENENSTYVVNDKRVVELIANGEKFK